MTDTPNTDVLSDARARLAILAEGGSVVSVYGVDLDMAAEMRRDIAVVLATPPASYAAVPAGEATVGLDAVLTAIRDRRDNGGGSASYQQACNHIIEAVSVLATATKVAPNAAVPAGEVLPQHIGRVHLGERRSDGERLCSHGHPVAAGQALYWPERMGEYPDDVDPICLEHAIEQAIDDNGWCEKCTASDFAPKVASDTGAGLRERAVMVCPQCEGEGGYPDGVDDAACHVECTRCGSNGWIVDLAMIGTAFRIEGDAEARLLREAASFASRIEAAGGLVYEGSNFERWKETARDLAPRLRAALSTDATLSVRSNGEVLEQAARVAEEWTFTPDEREKAAILSLCADQELSPTAVMRQSLRLYQHDHCRRKDGETVTWSGDAQRARDFAGPLNTNREDAQS